MAEFKPQIYSIDNFFWWISNDDYAGTSWTCYDVINCDIASSKWVQLSRNEWLNKSWTLINARWDNGKIIWVVLWNFPNKLLLSRDWRLYNYSLNEYDITWIKWGTYYNLTVITTNTGTYWVILAWNSILRWDFDWWDSKLWIWAAGINITVHLSLASWSFSTNSRFLVKWANIFISSWNSIYSIKTSLSTWLEDSVAFTINTGYDITYISNIGDQIIVYSNNGTSWKQSYWDWVNTLASWFIDWYDKPIIWGATLNNVDYLVVWTNFKRALYMWNGYNSPPLYETDIYSTTYKKSKFFFSPVWPNSIETIGNIIIIPWIWQIYKQWIKKIWLPTSITRDFILWSINNRTSDISCIIYQDSFTASLFLYYQANYSWTLSNYELNNFLWKTTSSTPYSDNFPWIVKWLIFDWGNYSAKKTCIKYRLGYKLPTKWTGSSTAINFYVRINNWLWYANFYVNWSTLVNSYTTAPTVWATYTLDWVTYTVYDVTKKIWLDATEYKSQWLIIHCTYTVEYNWDISSNTDIWTLTKASWTWDSTFKFTYSDYWFKLIEKFDWNNSVYRNNKWSSMLKLDFHTLQVKFDLLTNDTTITPELFDFKLLYNIIKDAF
jgi:hypothetical protein